MSDCADPAANEDLLAVEGPCSPPRCGFPCRTSCTFAYAARPPLLSCRVLLVVMQGGEVHADRGIGRVLGLSAHHGDPGGRPPVRREHGRRLREEPVRDLQSAQNYHVQPPVRAAFTTAQCVSVCLRQLQVSQPPTHAGMVISLSLSKFALTM